MVAKALNFKKTGNLCVSGGLNAKQNEFPYYARVFLSSRRVHIQKTNILNFDVRISPTSTDF